MAKAGEEAASYDSGGGAGVGGKFRKRPFRKSQTTPYDRPPTAVRNYNRGEGGGWLSKLIVDPASKLISSGAQMIFNSVFRKCFPPAPPLLPPPPPPESNQESSDRHQEAVTNLEVWNFDGAKESADEGRNPSNCSEDIRISELEQMLKGKSFTRAEVDRLTKLLCSRSVDLPGGSNENRSEANASKPAAEAHKNEDYAYTPIQENMAQCGRFDRITSTPVVCPRVVEEDVASPAELAKAYMQSRNSKVSPSMLGLRGQALREDATLLSNIQYTPKSSILPLVPRSAARVGASENGFTTPRSRGRSAMYGMARTPYSRVLPTSTLKGAGSSNYGHSGRPSSLRSQSALENDGLFGSKQLALKRRSSVLDDDIGSVGPIRNIRKKPNLYSRGTTTFHGKGVSSDASQHSTFSAHKPLLMESMAKLSKTSRETEDSNIPSTSYVAVPSKSAQTAAKILQQLEKLTPEKFPQSKPVAVKQKLTADVLSGQARKSDEGLDSSKLPLHILGIQSLEDCRTSSLANARESTSQKQHNFEANGSKKLSSSAEFFNPTVTTDPSFPRNDALSNFRTGDSVSTKFVAQPPEKKRAFQMDAHEDSLVLDDNVHSNGPTLHAEGREKLETTVVQSKTLHGQTIAVGSSSDLTQHNLPEEFVLTKKTDLGTCARSSVDAKDTVTTFIASDNPSSTSEPAVRSQPALAFDRSFPSNEASLTPPSFNFSSKNDEKTVPSINLASGPIFSTWSDPKGVVLNSAAYNAPGAIGNQIKIPDANKGDNNDPQKHSEIAGKLLSFSSAVSTSTTSGIFSFSALSNNSNIKNSSLISTMSSNFSASTPVLPSNNFAIQNTANGSSAIAFSINAAIVNSTSTKTVAVTTSNSSLSTSGATASFPFQLAPVSTPGTVSMTSAAVITDLKTKTEKEAISGNLASKTFGATSFTMGSAGSTIFGFASSVASSASNNQSKVPLFGSSSGSLVSAWVPPAGSGVPLVSQSMPIQFGSSATSPVFGTSSPGSSLFGSSTPASKSDRVGNSLGSNSSASAAETNSVAASPGASSIVFSFGSAASSSGTPSLSSSNGATSSAFTFGLSSLTAAGANLVRSDSTFSSPSLSTGFSFAASSTAPAATSAAPLVFGFSTGASSKSLSFTAAASGTVPTSPFTSLPQKQPIFGNAAPVDGNSPSNGDQMNMEDSMAEDPLQSSPPAPAIPSFGQPPLTPPSTGFMFSSAASTPGPFQFGGQPNEAVPQNPSPFQSPSSSSLGGSFSLGSGGGDKSSRKIVRISRTKNRKQ